MALVVREIEVRPGVFASVKVTEKQAAEIDAAAAASTKRRTAARNKAAATDEETTTAEEQA